MFQYYFIFHSVTSAQRALFALRNKGIEAMLSSAPGVYSSKGCAYALQVKGSDAYFAAGELRNDGMHYQRVLRTKNNDFFEEVVL